MAPKRGQSIEHTDEHDEFIKKVAEYCEQRGTTFEPEPKVGVRHVDLLRLYTRVVEEGGYDLVSDTKAKPLMWRKLAEEFVGRNQYSAAQAFQIKNVYYKNLCAYEISTHWQKEPPPKEILEDVTAKGGNVMGRTLENFVRPSAKDPEQLPNGDTSDGSPERNTPKEEKAELHDDPGSTSGRSSRGLRHQPPQRVLFQPELVSGRQTRGQTQASLASPSPGAGLNGIMNASSLSNGAVSTLASYEPSQAYPLSLKPVITPANNPEFYRNERKRKLEANAGPLAKKYRSIMLPGTGFIGPNIYVRAQLALQSGMPSEEQYALHHLVKISHERGDKYRFDQFPGLADALVQKVLQVAELFYDIKWSVTYSEDASEIDDETLNGLTGTPNLLRNLRSRIPLVSGDSILDDQFLSRLNRITEAGLVLRNMSVQDENAMFLGRLPLLHDLVTVVLSLPHHPDVEELRHYILDTAEQVLRFVDLSPQAPVYQLLLLQAQSSDRGASAAAFRTISRINMAHPSAKRLDDVPTSLLQRCLDYILVEDEELRSASLDFLMQYTSFADNVESLLRTVDAEMLAHQLSRLLLFSAREYKERSHSRHHEAEDAVPPAIPRLSRSLIEGLLKFEEPERSSEWLRMCFLADPNAEMTQISLWQAYQGTFGPFHPQHPQMIAGDFIKNVSNTFQGATAQVAGSNKYVIRGIKSRKTPIDTGMLNGSRATDKGRELCCCHWKMVKTVEGMKDPVSGFVPVPTTREEACAEWFRNGTDMLGHILHHHLHLPTRDRSSADGDKMEIDSKTSRPSPAATNGLTNGNASTSLHARIDFAAADKTVHRCRWADCNRASTEFDGGNVSRTKLFARHIETHVPVNEPAQAKHNIKPDARSSYLDGEVTYLTTLEDEQGDAAGLPLRAATILRNIALFMPKTLEPPDGSDRSAAKAEGETRDVLMMRIFDDVVRERLFFAFSYNRTIKSCVARVLSAIRRTAG